MGIMNINIHKLKSPKKLIELIEDIKNIFHQIVYNRQSKLSFEYSYRSIYLLILHYKGYITLYKLLQSHEKEICNSDYKKMKNHMDLIREVCLYPLRSIELDDINDGNFSNDGKSKLEMWFDKMRDIELLKRKAHKLLYTSNIHFPAEINNKIEMHVL
jgi:hypothetical protein